MVVRSVYAQGTRGPMSQIRSQPELDLSWNSCDLYPMGAENSSTSRHHLILVDESAEPVPPSYLRRIEGRERSWYQSQR